MKDAIIRLREAHDKADIKSKEISIYRDATIQRFEFTIELFWKVLKKFLNHEQIQANTPREVLRQSYTAKIIDDEEIWLKMTTDRNLTSHTYKEHLAKEIFSRIELYLPILEKTYKKLEQRFIEI
ncbi:MAG: nucleotidyltransferase substrate binding protein [Rickettsiales bacterium]|nr:nucleotidyltransferase substrate binding protein [Rickettsiales bacterium]